MAVLAAVVVGAGIGVVQAMRDPSVVITDVASAFTVADLEVAPGWWLVVGADGEERQDGLLVLSDVEVTNVGDEPHEVAFEMEFSSHGDVVSIASCRDELLAPGESRSIECDGTRQVLPTDFDMITARPLDG